MRRLGLLLSPLLNLTTVCGRRDFQVLLWRRLADMKSPPLFRKQNLSNQLRCLFQMVTEPRRTTTLLCHNREVNTIDKSALKFRS